MTLFCLPSRRVSPSWRSCVGLGHLAAASSTPDGAARSTLRPRGGGADGGSGARDRPARTRARAGFGGQAAGGAVGGRGGSGGGSTTFGGTPRDHRPCLFTRCISCENLFMTARPSPTLHLSPTHAHRQSSFVGADPRTTGAARATRVDSSAARAPCPRWAAPEARGGADESSSAAIRGAATATHRPPSPEAGGLGRLVAQVGRTTAVREPRQARRCVTEGALRDPSCAVQRPKDWHRSCVCTLPSRFLEACTCGADPAATATVGVANPIDAVPSPPAPSHPLRPRCPGGAAARPSPCQRAAQVR